MVAETRADDDHQVEHDRAKGQPRDDDRADIVHDAAGAPAHALKPDGQRQADIDIKRHLGDAVRRPVDVAAGHVVADLEDGQQHREQDGAGIDHARRQIIGAPA